MSRRYLLRNAIFVCFLACLSVNILIAQNVTPPKAPLTNHDVLEMQKAGLTAAVIIARIQAGPCAFDLSTSALKELKDAGISDNITLVMVRASTPALLGASGSAAGDGSDFAHLRVYRHHRYEGSALSPSIYIDDRQVARIGNGRRCSIRLSPGTHTVRSDDKSSAISIDAKAGQEYFIRIDEQTGFWKGHGKLVMVLPEQGKAEYKLEKPVEEDRKILKEIIEDGTAGNQN